MKHLRLLIALACAGLFACSGGSSPSPAPAPPTPAPPPPNGGTASVTVSMPAGSQFLTTTAYVPDQVTVAIGTTVTFVNNDQVAHTATSQNNLWDSGDIQPGHGRTVSFQSAGTFSYYCIYHPRMVGTITVQ